MNIRFTYPFIPTLVMALVSCTAEIPRDPSAGKGAELEFAVSDITRSAVTISLDEFAVYGDMKLFDTNVDNGNASPTVIFNKTEVKRINDAWSYQGTQYWFPNHEYSFVALYPQTVLEEENATQYDNSKLTFNYALPTSDGSLVNENQVVDIVAATHRRLYSESDATSVISFRFAHLLSLVNFSLELIEDSMNDDEFFKIHKMELSGFGTSSIINIKPAPRQTNNQTDDREFDISTAQEEKGRIAIEFEEPISVTNKAPAVKMFENNKALIMLPQNFTDNNEVQILLTYSVNNEEETTQVSGTLSNFKWESGKSYNYKIKLELDEPRVASLVISNATIVPWNLIDDSAIVDAR